MRRGSASRLMGRAGDRQGGCGSLPEPVLGGHPTGLPDPEESPLEGRFQAWGDLWRGIQAPVSVGGDSGSSGAPTGLFLTYATNTPELAPPWARP